MGKVSLRQNVLVTIAIALLVLLFGRSLWSERLAVLSTDLLLFARHQVFGLEHQPQSSSTVVIALDEETYRSAPFANLPKVLWTPMIAKVQDAVIKAGASVIGYDIIFPTSLESHLPGYEKPFLVSLLKGSRQGKIVLGKAQHSNDPVAPHPSQAFVVKSEQNIRALNMKVDLDDVIRRIPLQFARQSGGYENSMALELASRASGQNVIRNDDHSVSLGDYRIPGSVANGALINFQGGADIPTYSLVDLYNCIQSGSADFFNKHFAGRVVLIGGVLDVEDRKQTSKRWMTEQGAAAYQDRCMGEKAHVAEKVERDSIPGVFITATAVNNLLHEDFLDSLSLEKKRIVLVALAVLMSLLSLRFKPVQATFVMLGSMLLVTFTGVGLLHEYLLVVPVLNFAVAIFLSYSLVLIYRYLYLDRQKNLLRNVFSLYLEPKLVDQMVESEKLPELGGEEREITAWFADLANFTSISEGLSPNELVSLMNVYFAAVTEIIESHGGFVAQYVGDEVYSVFGAPFNDKDMAGHAVAAALTLKERLRVMNSDGSFGDRKIVARIGINLGPATVGNVGSKRRLNYAIMGDTVNLGSRLEGANKATASEILVSDSVAERLPTSFILRELATIRVKGKAKPTRVYEPIYMKGPRPFARGVSGAKGSAVKDDIAFDQHIDFAQQQSEDFHLAQTLIRESKFADAIEVLAAYPDDAAAQVITERAKGFIANPPPAGWDGVVTLTSK